MLFPSWLQLGNLNRWRRGFCPFSATHRRRRIACCKSIATSTTLCLSVCLSLSLSLSLSTYVLFSSPSLLPFLLPPLRMAGLVNLAIYWHILANLAINFCFVCVVCVCLFCQRCGIKPSVMRVICCRILIGVRRIIRKHTTCESMKWFLICFGPQH